MPRDFSAETWPAEYFDDYRPEDGERPVTQDDVRTFLHNLHRENDSASSAVSERARTTDEETVSREFGCTRSMASALVAYMQNVY